MAGDVMAGDEMAGDVMAGYVMAGDVNVPQGAQRLGSCVWCGYTILLERAPRAV